VSQNVSITWRSLYKAFNFLHGGFIYRVSNGDLSLWFDLWLQDDILGSEVDAIHIIDLDFKVLDLWCGGKWNFYVLATQISDLVK
jgi:hypothetical protein